MKNYLELKVPLTWNANWFVYLRHTLKRAGIDIKWKKMSTFHITAVFVEDIEHVVALRDVFDRVLGQSKAPSLTIDKIGVFQAKNTKKIIVHLDSTKKDEELMPLINALREGALQLGAHIEDFLFHITLGESERIDIDLEQTQRIIDTIHIPTFTLHITQVEYRYYHSGSIRKWKLSK